MCIRDRFAAGFIPGAMMALAMAACVYVISKRKNFPIAPKMPWGMRIKCFWSAIPSLMTIVIIIGGIWGGFFTATEAAIVASFYALFLSGVVYLSLIHIYIPVPRGQRAQCRALLHQLGHQTGGREGAGGRHPQQLTRKAS